MTTAARGSLIQCRVVLVWAVVVEFGARLEDKGEGEGEEDATVFRR